MTDSPQKHCPECDHDFPATSDHFHKNGKQGLLHPYCKKCRNARNKRFRQAHHEENLARNKRYYDENLEKEHARSKRYLATHQEKESARRRRKYEKNRERELANVRRYQNANREKVRVWDRIGHQKRRAHKVSAPGTHTMQDIQAQYERQKGKCYYCKAKVETTYHIDHVIPIAKGGSNGPDNLVIACPSCNMHKSDNLWCLL